MADLYFKAAALTDRKTRKFNLDAYNGGELAIDLFDVPTFIDLDGVSFASNVVLLVEHDPYRMIGHAEKIEVKEGKITAEGVISRSNVDSWDVVESAENGFPWQCSVGGPLIDYIELAAGETLEVNGRKVAGPAVVVTKLEIREISFVALGADDTTSATLAAKRAEAENISVPLEKEIVKMADENVNLVADQTSDAERLTAYRKEQAEETRRIEAIRKAAGGQFAELEAKAIEEGWTAERA